MDYPSPGSWLVERLLALPPQVDVALILRHAERETIPPGTFGADAALTPDGVSSAERLGAALAGMRARVSATTSPVPRCVATTRAILRGGGRPEEVSLDWRLGDPGPFAVDTQQSGPLFLKLGPLGIARRQLEDAEPPKGMRATSEGVELLLELVMDDLGTSGRLNIYVTHDSILAVFVAYLYGLSVDEIGWPGYLDGLLLWRQEGQLRFVWRGLDQASYPLRG